MEKIRVIFGYFLIFVGMLIALSIAGKHIKRIPPNVVRRVNQVSFIVAVVSGLLLYFLDNPIFMYLFAVSLISFFLFYNYETKK